MASHNEATDLALATDMTESQVHMPKGNHVFNNFDGSIHNAYMSVLEVFKHDDALKAVSGSGGDVTVATKLLTGTYDKSYTFYQQVTRHETVALIHSTQDNEEIVPNDPNSREFGELSAGFTGQIKSWVYDMEEANPLESWRLMVNCGFDKTAFGHYVNEGSSQPGTPASPQKRRGRCEELHKFIKGELTKLATNWMLALRLDLQLAKQVKYSTKPLEWKALLEKAKTAIK